MRSEEVEKESLSRRYMRLQQPVLQPGVGGEKRHVYGPRLVGLAPDEFSMALLVNKAYVL